MPSKASNVNIGCRVRTGSVIFQDWKVLEKGHWSWKVLEIC